MSDNFEVVERPVDKEAELKKERDIFEALLFGNTVQKVLKTSRGDFTAIFPLGRERLRMDRIRAARRRGIPAEAFDEYANYNNNVWSTLDVVITDGPEWYKNAKKKNPAWSWEEGPDEELTVELFELVCSFRGSVTTSIRESKVGRTHGESRQPADEPAVDDGAFSGLTNGPQG